MNQTFHRQPDEGEAMRCFTRRSAALRAEPVALSQAKPAAAIAGPSERFIGLTRNIEKAQNPPRRFEPTVKNEGDVVV